MRKQPVNLLKALPEAGAEEHFETLLRSAGVRLERIVSHGHASPVDFWYDQPGDEWVLLLQGGAELEIEDQGLVPLQAGDSLLIPAHCRHRVASTGPNTVWLAVHLAAG